jgi:sugar lactone lactonase YvrE
MLQLSQDEPLLKMDMQLGEGPLYDEQTGILHFVDV